MAKKDRKLLSQLTSEGAKGPFATIVLDTHVVHQDMEKGQIKFKNFAEEAKKYFEKKYSEHDWSSFQEEIENLPEDPSFWRSATTSIAIIITAGQTYIRRLSIPVDDQYYVSDLLYLLTTIKDGQFSYSYHLLGLSRDSMKLYEVSNKQVKEVSLPKGAPIDVATALGSELTGGGLNLFSNGGGGARDGVTFHGVNPKDEEVEIDWVNYYQAVDTYLEDSLKNPEQQPIYLLALPENQTIFEKIARNPYYCADVVISASPTQLSFRDIEEGVKKLSSELVARESEKYNKLLNRRFTDQLVNIVPAAKEGKTSHLLITTSNLTDGFGEDPETEYDRRRVLSALADDVIISGGKMFISNQKDVPDEKSLTAILHYQKGL